MQTSGRNNTSRLIKIAVTFVMGVLIVIVALRLLSPPPSGRIFTGITTVWCMYTVKVIAFADYNSDGLQSSDEPGISAVTVSLQHLPPEKRTPQPEQTTTDANGMAALNADKFCPTDDTLMVNAVAPSGYRATTPLSFGPYPVPEVNYDSLTRAAQNPIPEVIYIGLHKN
jgi:hypothetical protein